MAHVQSTEKLVEEVAEVVFQLGRQVDHKVINKLLALLTNDLFCKEALKQSFTCFNEVEEIMRKKLETQMLETGFEKFWVHDDRTGAAGYGFRRCVIRCLQNQISGSNHRNTLYHETKETTIAENAAASSHPMTARLGLEAVPAVRKSIENCDDISIFWHNLLENGKESFVGCIQLYSDKSKMALKTTTFEFYPLHISLLNFREGYRRSLVSTGKTIVAYLPAGFISQDEFSATKKQSADGRKERISILHSALDLILRPLRKTSIAGMDCEDSDGVKRLCHTVLCMYCADIPEAKDIACVRWGTKTSQPCHRCHVQSNDLNKFGHYPIRKMTETVKTINESNEILLQASKEMSHLTVSKMRLEKKSLRAEAKKLLDDISVSSRIPFLHNWPLSASHPLLDGYSIFKFEPLHNLHLGISKLIKNCSIERLGREDLFSTSLKDKRGEPKSFLSCRSYIIGEVNVLLQRVQLESPGPGLHIDFSSKSKGVRLSGLFQKDGIHSMLEANEMKSVDQVSPFVGAFLDRCCGETITAPSTFIYVKYAEILQLLWRRDTEAAMTERDYDEIEILISQIMPAMTDLFGQTHSSSCRTLKFHLLTHLADDLRSIGSIYSADAGFYESSHVQFKRHYRQTSRRHATALIETVSRIGVQQAFEKYLESENVQETENQARISPVKSETMTGDCCTFCKNGESLTLDILSSLRFRARKKRKFGNLEKNGGDYNTDNFSQVAKRILEDFSEQGLSVFIKLVRSKTRLSNGNCQPAEIPDSRVRMRRAQSAFVSGVYSPRGSDVWNDPDEDGCYYVKLEDRVTRRLQRLVCSQSFYGSKRFDTILISKSEEENGSSFVYFSKALGLFSIEYEKEFGWRSKKTPVDQEIEYLFVQYYEVLSPNEYDAVDKNLNCVKLRWAFSHDSDDTTPWYDLVPASAVRGVAHIVRGDYGLHRTVEHECSSKQDRDWRDQWFYVNRFRQDPSETSFYKHSSTEE